MTSQPITYRQLLSDHGRIRIPRLQRDYAQGRTGAKETEVRSGFLKALLDALERPVDADFAPLNLDFVYGSVEMVPDKHFSPLDGQQRLTTLFLLHWLLAWRDGRWDDFTREFCEGAHSRFAYRVRPSSNDFFDELVRHRPPMPVDERKDLRGWITDQSWYFRHWRLDPTVQGVLEMLQAMHERFKGRPVGLYARLTDTERPALTFQLLNLGDDFPLSDDLYIKMNARGKELTAFETFKARYEQKLPGHFPPDARRDIGGALFPMAAFVERRMDTAWTDFFWEHYKKAEKFDPKRLDEAFMNVFRMVALASRNPEAMGKERFTEDMKLLRDTTNPPACSTFEARGWLDSEFTALLVSLLETWCAGGPLPPPEIFPEMIDEPAKVTVPQALMFCGYALFIRKHEGQIDITAFADWRRVVHNLAANSEIETDRLQSASKGLRELLPNSHAILPRIAAFGAESVTGFSGQQQREEALKAGMLLADPGGWRPLIERAEQHGYFRGQIEFLLEFCSASAKWAETGDCAWDAGTHSVLQQSFLRYLEKAEAMFDAGGLIDLGKSRWERALLSCGDYLLLHGQTNYSFLENDASKPYSWKRLLRDDGDKRRCLRQLWDHPDYGQPLPAHLDTIIAAAADLPPWRAELVKSAAAVEYCCTIQRDWDYANQVYLLATTQRKGWHAELFTYVLDRELREAEAQQPFTPFSIGAYRYSRLKEEPPYLPLDFAWGENQISLHIDGRNGNFDLWIELPLPSDLLALLTGAGFAPSAEFPTWLVRSVAADDIEPALRELAALLTAS